MCRRLLALLGDLPGSDNSELAPHLKGLAMALHKQGKYEEANKQYKLALEVSEKSLL